MPLHAFGWTTDEDEQLADLVQPHTILYQSSDPSRKNILVREKTWALIAKSINKPAEECKKRWRGIRDSYMRCKRVGAVHKSKIGVFAKLDQFWEGEQQPCDEPVEEITESKELSEPEISLVEDDGTFEETIEDLGDGQADGGYYEITFVDPEQEVTKNPKPDIIKILPKPPEMSHVGALQQTIMPPKLEKPTAKRRKRNQPPVANAIPVKILPKPIILNTVSYQEQQNILPSPSESRSQVIDNLIEKILKDSVNEIDVFFRSMSETVKKMHPSLIPKVKMEVCNVVAKYEMQSVFKK